MFDEKTIRDDRFVLMFPSGQIVPVVPDAVRSDSVYQPSNEQPSLQYLYLTCVSGNESGSAFKILRCNVLRYEPPRGDYNGKLFVAYQSILEKLGAPFGGFWKEKKAGEKA